VIFPKLPFIEEIDGAGSWQPAPRDIAALERLLKTALKSALRDPSFLARGRNWHTLTEDERHILKEWYRRNVRAVLRGLGTYRRQYAGITRNNVRTILVNAFRGEPPGWTDPHNDWRREWVDVKGGGTSYWQIEFDIAKGTFHDFEVNADK
jgi:hypothetical protein